ncbi:MAG: response regulator [Pseudomonadota bacterium]
MTTGSAVTFLLVEDDDVDVMGIKRALVELDVTNPLMIAHDGQEALDFLRGDNGKTKVSPPFVILLDLNMPRMNGIEFLDVIRNDDQLRSSIVFVLTTSNSQDDKIKAYNYNVAGYIVKSNTTNSFKAAVQLLDYYCESVDLPT